MEEIYEIIEFTEKNDKKLINKTLYNLCNLLEDQPRREINKFKIKVGLTVENYSHYNFYPNNSNKKYLSDFLSVFVLLNLEHHIPEHLLPYYIYNEFFKYDGQTYYGFKNSLKKDKFICRVSVFNLGKWEEEDEEY